MEVELGRHLVRLTNADGDTEALSRMCDGCAFRSGTEANQYGPTLLTAIQCVVDGEPFNCHDVDPDGKPVDSGRVCQGWLAATSFHERPRRSVHRAGT